MKTVGPSFLGVLLLIFITLKLAQVGTVAAWSWWMVLSPLWISGGITLLGFVFWFFKEAIRLSKV